MPAAQDVYSVAYLLRSGEQGKYNSVGGLVRDRPLPIGPWTSPYWVQINDAIEILRARRMGADGFAYDMTDLHNGRWGAGFGVMLDTAAAVAPDFRIVAEPDMGILSASTIHGLETQLAQVWPHPASYHLGDGRLLITPFAAEKRTPAIWQQVTADMAAYKSLSPSCQSS